VAICALKRFAADQVDLGTSTRPWWRPRARKSPSSVSGPAGLSCAYQLALRGYRPTIFEPSPKPEACSGWASPTTGCPRTSWTGRLTIFCAWGELKTNSAMGGISPGQSDGAGLPGGVPGIGCTWANPGIEGEDADGVMQGWSFSGATILGEPLTIGKRLSVIGGGNVAITWPWVLGPALVSSGHLI